MAKRLVGHHRAEVGAADADVHDIADRLAGVAEPIPGADPVGEHGHAVEHLVDLGDDVLAVDDERGVAGEAQRRVQDGAVLGAVDPVTAEHGVDPLAEPALLGKLHEEAERLVGHAVLRVVEIEAGRLGGQAGTAGRVGSEEVAEVDIRDRTLVCLECLERRALPQRCRHARDCRSRNQAWPPSTATSVSAATTSAPAQT